VGGRTKPGKSSRGGRREKKRWGRAGRAMIRKNGAKERNRGFSGLRQIKMTNGREACLERARSFNRTTPETKECLKKKKKRQNKKRGEEGESGNRFKTGQLGRKRNGGSGLLN